MSHKILASITSKNKDVKLFGYNDSDRGNNVDDRKPTSGNCFSLGIGLVTWSSRKQTTVALSSTKADYIAITSASAQALWMRKVLEEIGERKIGSTILFYDN